MNVMERIWYFPAALKYSTLRCQSLLFTESEETNTLVLIFLEERLQPRDMYSRRAKLHSRVKHKCKASEDESESMLLRGRRGLAPRWTPALRYLHRVLLYLSSSPFISVHAQLRLVM